MILHHICSCFKPACSIMFDYVKPTMWSPPVISWFISPSIYSYLRTINHSDIGAMFTNLAIERGPHIFHHFPSFSIWNRCSQVPAASKNPSEVDILRRGFRSPEAPQAIPSRRIAPMLRGGIFLADSSVGFHGIRPNTTWNQLSAIPYAPCLESKITQM